MTIMAPYESILDDEEIADSSAEEVVAFPTSFGQQRLWFLDQLMPGSVAYHLPSVVQLGGHLDLAALEQAFTEISRRHESLRTTFALMDGSPVQIINPPQSFILPLIDLRDLPEPERKVRILWLARDEAELPFDLEQGPLLRVNLLKLQEEEHVLLFTMHHIISDGWSMGVLTKEVASLYAAFSSGKPSPLPELPIQYADFSHWQREWFQGDVLDAQLAYWKQQLADAPPRLELPTDGTRSMAPTFRSAVQSIRLSTGLSGELNSLSRHEGATLFITLLAAFKILLYRYTGQADILVGTPIAGRNRAEVEVLIGFFVNTLVLRTDLHGDPTFKQLIGRVREVALGAYAHQDLPFEKLVEELQPERDLSRTPLFQVLMVLQNAPTNAGGGLELPGLRLNSLGARSAMTQFDLTLGVVDSPEGLVLSIEFQADLFDNTTITRMLDHFQCLLRDIVAHPSLPISRLRVMSEQERRQLLVEWNDTECEFPSELCLHELFERQAELTPSNTAVVFNEQRLTYRELNERANQLAHHLLQRGITPDSLVAIFLHRSLDMVVALLATLKAGAAYLPLDPDYPQRRISFMLADAGASLVITQQVLVDGLPPNHSDVISLDSDSVHIAQHSVNSPDSTPNSSNLAYVIYTSGSTGLPKGVAIEHRSAVAFVHWSRSIFSPAQLAGVLASTSICFDLSIFELFSTLSAGGAVILAENALALPTLPGKEDVTLINTVPSAMSELLRLDAVPASVRTVNLAGEALSKTLVQQVYRREHVEAVYNLYGPSEDTTYTTYALMNKGVDETPTIGRPISNTRIYVLDRELNEVPVGASGELYIAGAGLARGYLGRADLTAERFVPDPFAEDGGRIYRTGDVARYRGDGQIEYVGRSDEQVKIRGFRIELGEVEAVLEDYGVVAEAVVVAREEQEGEGKKLVAYVTMAGEEKASLKEMRSYLEERLPGYMVPVAFVFMDEMPRTQTGKINRRALPAPIGLALERQSSFVEARTPVEASLVEMWREVLRVERVGVEDNFFELGGHSLLATQVVSRIRKAFQMELQLRRVFEYPTIAGLAGYIEIAMRAGQSLEAPAIERVYREEGLSVVQQRLWLLEQLKPGSPAYHQSAALRLNRRVETSALERAFGQVVRRQESLRTTFTVRDRIPVQVINPPQPFSLPLIDLSSLPEELRDDEAANLMREGSRQAFDLEHGPLLRAHLLQLGESEFILHITMHHLIGDALSLNILVRELTVCVIGASEGVTESLPELPIQYADFAQQERERLQGDTLAAQLDYWKQQLAGAAPVLDLPTDRSRPPTMTFSGASLSFIIPSGVTTGLRDLGQRDDATIFMILLSAFQSLLYRYTGQEDILTGSLVANRQWPGTENVIGPFVNTLVLRTDLSGDPSFRGLLRRVREVVTGAHSNQDVPFESLLEELQPERDLSRSPIFQTMFACQSAPSLTLGSPGVESTTALMTTPCEATKFDLSLLMAETNAELQGSLEYNPDLFDAATISRFLQHFINLLQVVSAQPDQNLSRLSLLSSAELNQLRQFNSTDAPFPSGDCIHHLFETQAALNPERVALSFGVEQVTYQQLNERANQLSHYLRRVGIRPESLVGICMGRSIEMVVAILAVLKAGGAYVPLDTQYPAERLRVMVEDAGVRMVLVSGHEAEWISGMGVEVLHLENEQKEIGRESAEDGRWAEEAENLAYVIYTSGSTGRPKGVEVSHAGLVNLVTWHQRQYRVSADTRATQVAAQSFDASVWEIWPYLATGASVHLIDEETVLTTHRLWQWFNDNSITHCFLPTPLAETLISHVEAIGDGELQGTSKLRYLLTGGDKLNRGPQKTLPFELVNHYGPTENTVVSTSAMVSVAVDGSLAPKIGKPIANTKAYVLDHRLQVVPIGAMGELYVGGAGLARGYCRRADLTADRFVPNPFGSAPGERMYGTGDLVRFIPDGNLQFIGRVDQQVKVRGFRIELGEIEAVLATHPSVRQSVVVARSDSAADKRLVAYIVCSAEAQPSTSELHQHLQQRLPAYMLPSAFVMLAELPLTPHGKVDRRALPAPTGLRPELEGSFVEPRTPVESSLVEMWREVLRVERVGVEDNFFQLGGHSLLATQVISRVREAFQVEIALHQFFEHPRVSELAQLVEMTDRNKRSDFEEIARALEAVEGLSEEELQAFLSGTLVL